MSAWAIRWLNVFTGMPGCRGVAMPHVVETYFWQSSGTDEFEEQVTEVLGVWGAAVGVGHDTTSGIVPAAPTKSRSSVC